MTSITDPRMISPPADGWQRAQIASPGGRYGALEKATDQARRIEFGGPYQSECRPGGPYGALKIFCQLLAAWLSASALGGDIVDPMPRGRQCGVSWVAGRPVSERDLLPLVDGHVNWIVQTPFGWQRDSGSPQIRLATGGGIFWGETDAGLVATTRLARARGIRTLLKPHIWLTNRRDGIWRGEIRMKSEQDWQRWFSDYRRFILHYAQLAQDNKIEILCIGTELRRTVTERPDDWRGIIRDVREIYRGKLTYGANWYAEFEEIPFWDALDFIGIHAYFPLADQDGPDLADLLEGWQTYLGRIERLHTRFDKPVLFTELGYRSATFAASKPWEWPRPGESSDPDLQLQAKCYEAFFQTFWDKPWFAGVYFWKWYPSHERAGGPEHAGFTPQNKPAEQVMAHWYRSTPSGPAAPRDAEQERPRSP